MIFNEIPLKGAYTIEHITHKDNRGSFSTTYCKNEFSKAGISLEIDQSSFSFSEHLHTLRGMHYQAGEYAQDKLVKCVRGKILDVIIDIREDSETFGQFFKQILSEENNIMLWVPKGFAHGLLTLEPNSLVLYQLANFYHKPSDRGIRWNDPFFNIDWPVSDPVLSEKDATHPNFKIQS